MADKPKKKSEDSQGGTATKSKPQPKKNPPRHLPVWKVLLHNDDKNAVDFVILSIVELTPLDTDAAVQRTMEANDKGLSLLLVTHKERAELYQEQFQSKGLSVTIEPAD